MNLRLLTNSLLFTTLLSSTLGCSKKDDPTPLTVSTGSYKLDGVLKTCQVKAATGFITSQNTDELNITLTVTPQPASGTEAVALTFSNSYQLEQIVYFTNGGITGTLYRNDVTTLQQTNGSYSGTFSGTSVTPFLTSAGATVYPKLTDGVFADVQL
jgi:hypothetical protein